MKHTIVIVSIFFLTFLISSCEKVIDIHVNDEVGRLVIEGAINNTASQQEIKLSRNAAFSGGNNYPAVTGATVIVRNQKQQEYTFVETESGTYKAQQFAGIPGETYTMEVRIDQEKYQATSQMPQIVTLDSVSVENPKFGDKEKRNIKVFYKDPADQINQYRFVVFLNDKQLKDIYAVNDDFNNGNEISLTLRPDDVDMFPGDRIRVEMLCVDKTVYNYWYSLMQQSANSGVTPSNPPTNISPVALGYFSAHTFSTKSVQVD
ncbi:DUF4249 domain-containing protein [Sphingobacterium sp. HMA12]|uniref:DUF4249 domain-containing protein n=1 Tax=Sphingobacterium sp. HMA12 TaxID=2050894 RepID=UPI000CEA2DB0|nr:DUF4249 domain-containing protein [Sphingobacterium sp. HMA12]